MNKILSLLAAFACFSLLLVSASCNDNADDIGSSLSPDDVNIQVDSIFTVKGESVYCPVFDAKSPTQLIGHINVPQYGDLECSFVSQMLSATKLNVPDSITTQDVDSLKLRLRFANGNLTGDSLAPQQLKVYALNKQLPSDITNDFDPTGYYNPSSPLGVRPYTGSALGMNDDVYANSGMFRAINVPMPLEMARKIFDDYRNNPSVFASVEAFNQYFPGFYACHSFGRGMVVNITSTDMLMYYHTLTKKYTTVDGVTVASDSIVRDSIIVSNVSPEIISSNRIRLNVAQSLKNRVDAGETVLVSPAGYNVRITFPAREIVEKYKSNIFDLSVINSLTFSIPVEEIQNDFNIAPPPYLLMVPTAKMQEFFVGNNVPDDITSFYAVYDSTNHAYLFSTLRTYIINMLSKQQITDEDIDFTLVPVNITTESADLYGTTICVSSCVPYMNRPSMAILHLDKAKIRFTYAMRK